MTTLTYPAGAKGWSSVRTSEAAPRFLPWVTGRFYTCPYDTTLSTGTASTTLMRGVPIYVPNPTGVTVTSIGVEVTTGGTGSTARFGIYGMLPSGLPGTLIIDGGTVATTAIAFTSVAVSKFLRQGWYFIASVNTGTPPAVRRFTGTVMSMGFLGLQSSSEVTGSTGYLALADGTMATNYVNNGLPGSWPVWSSSAAPATSQDRLMVGI